MNIYEIALITAGCIGCLVAIIHGVLMQKLIIKPLYADTSYSIKVRRLIAVLLHFSTFCWFFGGLALIASPFLSSLPAMLTIALFVGMFYSIGAIGNLWATKGRHPGWVLLAASVGLITYAVFAILN